MAKSRKMSDIPLPVEVFISYADADEPLCNELEKHLRLLRHEGLITSWHRRQIVVGTDWAKTVDQHLKTASIILLLISADYMASTIAMGWTCSERLSGTMSAKLVSFLSCYAPLIGTAFPLASSKHYRAMGCPLPYGTTAMRRSPMLPKASRKLVDGYQVIVFEDLQTKNLTTTPKPKQDEQGTYLPNGAAAKAGLNKSILDAGWRTFTGMVVAKAASAGRTVLFVNPSMTAQRCSGCGAVVKKTLADRWYTSDCGISLDRDTNSAILILNVGYQQLAGGTRPTRETA